MVEYLRGNVYELRLDAGHHSERKAALRGIRDQRVRRWRRARGDGSVTVRLKTPSTQTHFEQWAAIMERVAGRRLRVNVLAHLIQDDADSTWPLASRGQDALGCAASVACPRIGGSLYAMARVLPEQRVQGVGTILYQALCRSMLPGSRIQQIRNEGSSGAARMRMWCEHEADNAGPRAGHVSPSPDRLGLRGFRGREDPRVPVVPSPEPEW